MRACAPAVHQQFEYTAPPARQSKNRSARCAFLCFDRKKTNSCQDAGVISLSVSEGNYGGFHRQQNSIATSPQIAQCVAPCATAPATAAQNYCAKGGCLPASLPCLASMSKRPGVLLNDVRAVRSPARSRPRPRPCLPSGRATTAPRYSPVDNRAGRSSSMPDLSAP